MLVLCSRNAHTDKGWRGSGQVPFMLAEGGREMTPVSIPCSRSAHDQNVLARRPQGDQHVCHSWESETSKLGRNMFVVRYAQ